MKGTYYLWMAVVLFPSVFVEAALSEPPSLFVEGYSGQVSYVAGEQVALHVSTSAQVYSLEIARLGAQREVVMSRLEVPGKKYPVPENASSYGCEWPASYQFELPEDWTSGYYEVRLRVSDEGGDFQQRNRRTAEGQCYFIVRPQEPGTRTKILIQLSTNTYNAYNNWGGFSLYGYHGLNKVQGHRVSFLRPPRSQFGKWEHPFVSWAESNGYKLDYCANLDLEYHPELLNHYQLVLSVGHDEYWSALMRDFLEAYIERGGNVPFSAAIPAAGKCAVKSTVLP